MATTERQTVTVRDVMRITGTSKTSARRLLNELEAEGLRRKGRGSGTHYLADEFFAAYRKWDTRP